MGTDAVRLQVFRIRNFPVVRRARAQRSSPCALPARPARPNSLTTITPSPSTPTQSLPNPVETMHACPLPAIDPSPNANDSPPANDRTAIRHAPRLTDKRRIHRVHRNLAHNHAASFFQPFSNAGSKPVKISVSCYNSKDCHCRFRGNDGV